MSYKLLFLLLTITSVHCNCSKKNNSSGGAVIPPPSITPPAPSDVSYWVTKSDQTTIFQKSNLLLAYGDSSGTSNIIQLDSTQTFQTIDGFGYTLTGGSASLINAMNAASKAQILQELFSSDSSSIGVSYLRISLGASDLNNNVYSYDDLPAGQTDSSLTNFSLGQDYTDLIPILKQILAINPNIKILASPWSPPTWMKDNNNTVGGSLLTKYYASYANYFVKYIQQMGVNGINIDAVTVQNEPQNPNNNPSMSLSYQQEDNFVANNLGPSFAKAGLKTKIIIWDHNCDLASYPIAILGDANAYQYVDGSAFHLYAGDISALNTVHTLYPNKNIYFTEQWTSSTGNFSGDLIWHVQNVIIGSMNNWSKNALEWNLANDQNFNPHTAGGCTQCKGALTINGNTFTRNVSYYIVAHASKFVLPNSKRINSSPSSAGLSNVAFLRPDGKKVVIILNQYSSAQTCVIKIGNRSITTVVPPQSVATYLW